jgi:competence ComEA-like helix-hairpin-helix protein
MKPVSSLALGVAACALVVSTLSAATPVRSHVVPQQANGGTPEDPAAPLFNRMCSNCHDAVRVTSMRRTRTDWEDVLNKMIQEGATGTEKDFETVFDYLQRNYGKVYINRAQADEIALVTGLTKKDAEAIVAYRKANGDFANLDAVKKVPDIDAKKLDDRKDAIAF